MRKKMAALFGVAMAVSCMALATVAPDQIALGGVTPGMSVSALTAACGEPQAKNGDDWIYPAFKVKIDDDQPDVVESVSTSLPEAVTPGGLSVGQPESVILHACGAPDKKETEHGETEYEYYSTDSATKLEIEVHSGLITKISCSVRD